MLDGEFNVVEVTARGMSIANTFTFQAVVISNLVFSGPGADNIGMTVLFKV